MLNFQTFDSFRTKERKRERTKSFHLTLSFLILRNCLRFDVSVSSEATCSLVIERLNFTLSSRVITAGGKSSERRTKDRYKGGKLYLETVTLNRGSHRNGPLSRPTSRVEAFYFQPSYRIYGHVDSCSYPEIVVKGILRFFSSEREKERPTRCCS